MTKTNSPSYAARLHSFITESNEPVVLGFGKSIFTFTAEPDTVSYTLERGGEVIKTEHIDLSRSFASVVMMISEDTKVPVEPNDDNIAFVMINHVNVEWVLNDLLMYPPNYVSDPKYLFLISKLQHAKTPIVIKHGDVETTLKYDCMTLVVQVRIPNAFMRTSRLGRGGSISAITDCINTHYREIEEPAVLPNKAAIHEILDDLCVP